MTGSPYTFADWQSGALPKEGWDCADAIGDGWTSQEIEAFMRATARPFKLPAEKPTEKPAERVQPVAGPSEPAKSSTPLREARTVQQAQPEQATVTHIQTRKTVAADDGWKIGLITNDEGKLKPGVTNNWALFLENHYDMVGVFAFDAFKMRVMLMRKPPWDWRLNYWEPRPIQDRDYSEAVMWLEKFHMTPKASNIAAVIQTVAEHAAFDRLTDYLDGLKWDGRERIGTWLSGYLGAEDTPYTRTVGLRWLVSGAARGLKPGCKCDTMPILEGPQGALKSSALRDLYGKDFFTDGLSDIGSKDAKMEMQGVWGLEVAEMQKFSAAEVNDVKKFLTQQVDRFRPPYGRSVIEAPRRVVLNGTINPEGNAYLRDVTGARRFWPVTIGRIDADKLGRDRDQLWAEAVAHFREGTPWWVQADELDAVEAEQEKRTDVDVWVDLIVPVISGVMMISQVEIFEKLGIPKKDADWRQASRVGRIMKKLGWISGRDRRNNENKVMFYHPQRGTAGEEIPEDW